MALDLILLGVVLVFGLLGAVTGVASQLAQILGMVVAFFCARPIAKWIGPKLAASMQMPVTYGVIAMTIVVFIVLVIAVRVIAASVLRRVMAGRDDPHDRSLDRTLGMVFSAAKVAALAYVVLSALAFVEQHVVVAGKKLGLSPKDSHAFALARTYNLFEMTQFAPVKDLQTIAKAAREGDRKTLEANPAYRSLVDDPRFKKILSDPEMQRAIQAGDYQALLQNNLVMQLIQDPTIAARLSAAARDAQ